ncbi:NlpC/P60 family protein [Nocardia sp. NPDC005978]|uniref:C40 family peptidase n=1 Tax=Nocardia sp. NPDC005978 TaxID=3156725 RepID=UPI0033A80C84
MVLPILGQALGGLLGGNSQQPAGGGVSPEAARALQAISDIERLYGAGGDIPASRSPATANPANGVGGLDEYQRTALYQRNAANSYDRLDGQLNKYLSELAAKNKAAASELREIRADVVTRIRALNSAALTPAGRRQIDHLMVQALRRAHTIVGDTQATSAEIARAVDRLSDHYLSDLVRTRDRGTVAGEAAVRTALAQLGKKYVWAADGPSTFDCSGLMKYAAAHAGVRLPHNAAQQLAATRRIPANKIRPGDLIYPKNLFKGSRPGHVMMYIGDGKVVHAGGPKPSKVRIASLPKRYVASRWT